MGLDKKSSCEEHIFTQVYLIRTRKALGSETFVTFIDFIKAFNKADRYLLLYNLAAIGVSGKLFDIIKAMCSDNKCAIMFSNYVTPWFESFIGIRHCDSLSPTLLSTFINDLAMKFVENIVRLR